MRVEVEDAVRIQRPLKWRMYEDAAAVNVEDVAKIQQPLKSRM
jgi:hypothetical protein